MAVGTLLPKMALMGVGHHSVNYEKEVINHAIQHECSQGKGLCQLEIWFR